MKEKSSGSQAFSRIALLATIVSPIISIVFWLTPDPVTARRIMGDYAPAIAFAGLFFVSFVIWLVTWFKYRNAQIDDRLSKIDLVVTELQTTIDKKFADFEEEMSKLVIRGQEDTTKRLVDEAISKREVQPLGEINAKIASISDCLLAIVPRIHADTRNDFLYDPQAIKVLPNR